MTCTKAGKGENGYENLLETGQILCKYPCETLLDGLHVFLLPFWGFWWNERSSDNWDRLHLIASMCCLVAVLPQYTDMEYRINSFWNSGNEGRGIENAQVDVATSNAEKYMPYVQMVVCYGLNCYCGNLLISFALPVILCTILLPYQPAVVDGSKHSRKS